MFFTFYYFTSCRSPDVFGVIFKDFFFFFKLSLTTHTSHSSRNNRNINRWEEIHEGRKRNREERQAQPCDEMKTGFSRWRNCLGWLSGVWVCVWLYRMHKCGKKKKRGMGAERKEKCERVFTNCHSEIPWLWDDYGSYFLWFVTVLQMDTRLLCMLLEHHVIVSWPFTIKAAGDRNTARVILRSTEQFLYQFTTAAVL